MAEQDDAKHECVERIFVDMLEVTGYKNRWHLIIILGVTIVALQDGGNVIWPIFAAAHIPHRCKIPGLNSAEWTNVSHGLIEETFFTDKRGFGCSGVISDNDNGCSALNANPSDLLSEANNMSVTLDELLRQPENSSVLSSASYESCVALGNGYEFMPVDIQTSVTSEFSLICGGEVFRRIDKSLFSLGQCIGAFALGHLGDIYGRKMTILVQFGVEIFFIVGMALSNNLYVLMTFRFIVSMFNMAKYPLAVTFGAEIMVPKYRTLMGLLPGMEFGIGMAMYTILAYFIRTWRIYTTTGMWFCIPVMIYWIVLMPESPRWLLDQGRFREFQVIARDMERKCGKKFDPVLWKKLDELAAKQSPDATWKEKIVAALKCRSINHHTDGAEQHSTFQPLIQIAKQPLLRKWLGAFLIVWSTNMLLYYSLTMGQDLFNLDIYVFTFMIGIFEVPGAGWTTITINIIGRRASQILGMLMCAGCLILCKILEDYRWAVLIFASCSKLFITGTFCLVFLYTGEVLPTYSRASGIGLCSGFCRIAGTAFPYIEMMNTFFFNGASIVFMASLAIISAGATLILPETKGQELPEFVEDCELLAKGKLLPVHIVESHVLDEHNEENV